MNNFNNQSFNGSAFNNNVANNANGQCYYGYANNMANQGDFYNQAPNFNPAPAPAYNAPRGYQGYNNFNPNSYNQEHSGITFNIVCSFGTIGNPDRSGWSKELNLVSWSNKAPKYDLRSWSSNHMKMQKGVTLSTEELAQLYVLINKAQEQDENLAALIKQASLTFNMGSNVASVNTQSPIVTNESLATNNNQANAQGVVQEYILVKPAMLNEQSAKPNASKDKKSVKEKRNNDPFLDCHANNSSDASYC